METQLNDALVSTASRAARKSRARKPGILVEYCCGADSLLSQEWARAGGKAHRCGLPDDDLSLPKDVLNTTEHLGKGTAQRGSLPVVRPSELQ